MEKMKLRVSGNRIEMVECPGVITSGTVGLIAEFVFDSQWEDLRKMAVFRAGDKSVSVGLEEAVIPVPWEVLECPGVWLRIGAYGINAEGTIVIPTLWMDVAMIHTGTAPEGDPALDPTAPVWQELWNKVDNLTSEDVGAASLARIDEISDHLHEVSNLAGDNELAIKNHIESTTENPHGVTCEQINAVHVDAFDQRVENVLFQKDLLDHGADKENPHGVTCEQIGAATKAVIVTVSGTIPSHTNEQIFDTVVNGGSVYLKMWSGTYIHLSWCTATEALFEASLINSATAADGNDYPVQNFRTYRIVNDKYQANSAIVPSQAYVDAQIAALVHNG